MTPFRDLPIRRKVARAILLTSTMVVLLTGAAFMTHEWVTFRETALTQLTTIGRIIADNSTAAVRFRDHTVAAELLATLDAEPAIIAATLYDAGGQRIATFGASPLVPANAADPPAWEHGFVNGHLVVFEPLVHAGRREGTLCVVSSLAIMRQRFLLYGIIVLAILVTSALVAFALSGRLQRGITEPILELAQTAQAVTARQDYAMRATRYGNDELGALTDAFNRMLGEIKELNADLERRVAQRTAELEFANRELEAFTYSVSHDLRGPLRHIIGYTEMVRDDANNRLSEDSRGFLDRVVKAGEKLSRLVDSLLNLSRVGRRPLAVQTTKLDDLADAAIREFEAETRGRQIEWRRHPLPTVECDPGLMSLVFANLLSNALKYTRPRDVAVIEIGTESHADARAVFVRDNGVGYDPRFQEKLFGVFERLHSGPEFEGTGVGLAVVDRILRKHGGKIWAEGRPDEGATFSFTLPGM